MVDGALARRGFRLTFLSYLVASSRVAWQPMVRLNDPTVTSTQLGLLDCPELNPLPTLLTTKEKRIWVWAIEILGIQIEPFAGI